MYTRKRRTKRKRGGDPGLIAIAAVGAAALLATSFYLKTKTHKHKPVHTHTEQLTPNNELRAIFGMELHK